MSHLFEPLLDRGERRDQATHMKGDASSQGTRDPLIEAYKGGIDLTLIRENLKLSFERRLEKLHRLQLLARELKAAGRSLRP